MPDNDGRYTPAEAAALLGVKTPTLRGYLNRKVLPEPATTRIGKRVQRSFSREWIEDARRRLQGE